MADSFSLPGADMHRLFDLLEGELATAGIEADLTIRSFWGPGPVGEDPSSHLAEATAAVS